MLFISILLKYETKQATHAAIIGISFDIMSEAFLGFIVFFYFNVLKLVCLQE